MLSIENDPEKIYYVMTGNDTRQTKIAFGMYITNNLDTSRISLKSGYWEGKSIVVYVIPVDMSLLALESIAYSCGFEPTNGCITIHYSALAVITRQQYTLWSDKDPNCKHTTKLIVLWLMICKKLNVDFPLEIQFEIIQYLVADIRTCRALRPTIVPLLGPNVFV